MSDRIPTTPIKRPSPRRNNPSPHADALDALAAVASSTPPSPITTQMARTLAPTVSRRRRRRPPACRLPLLPVAWLSRLVDARPEAPGPLARGLPYALDNIRDDVSPQTGVTSNARGKAPAPAITNVGAHVSTTSGLREIIRCDVTTADVIASANTLCTRIAQNITTTMTTSTAASESNNITTATTATKTTTFHAGGALAVYFTSLEGILTREAIRLRGDVTTLSGRLVQNREFHACLMVLAWECAVAAYGLCDMSVLWTGMSLFDVSPFAVIKVLESFVKSLHDLPRQLMAHLRACEERLVECHVWRRGSELIALIEARENSFENQYDNGNDVNDVMMMMGTKRNNMTENTKVTARRTTTTKGKNSSKSSEFVLEMIYKKMLAVASIRTRELLLLLKVDHLAADVWSCLKRCLWERWRLLVGRHVDQLMLCCIYGVAKVRQCDVKFHTIIKLYWTMKHVVSRHRATATIAEDNTMAEGVVWDVVRKVLLEETDLSAALGAAVTEGGDVLGEGSGGGLNDKRDDIIKFYNRVFITSMRDILLQYGNNSNIKASHSTLMNRRDGPDATVVPTSTSAGGSDTTMTDGGPSPSPAERRRTMQTGDRLRETILNSPMRDALSPRQVGRVTVLAMSPINRRVTRMAASPLGGENCGHIALSPGTRTLYAFGESPVRGSAQEGVGVRMLQGTSGVRGIRGWDDKEEGGKGDANEDGNKDEAEDMMIAIGNRLRGSRGNGDNVHNEGGGGSLAPLQLNFDEGDGEERAETIRRRFAEQRSRASVGGANGRRHGN